MYTAKKILLVYIAISLLIAFTGCDPQKEESNSSSTSSSSMELSVADDWKKPVEDNYNGGFSSEYKPDYPEYIPAEGDTGQNGEDWELPEFDLDNDGVSGEIK